MEDLESELRQARIEETSLDQFHDKSARTSIERLKAVQQRDEKVRLAFDAGYLRGRRDHMQGAFGHAAVFVWVALMAGIGIGAFLTWIPQ